MSCSYVAFYGVGSPRLFGTKAIHASLSSGSTPARSHLLTSIFTHSDHVFWGLLFSAGNTKVCDRFDTGHRPLCGPYHVSRWQWRTDVISLMPSFCSSQAEGVLSLVFDAADPTDHGTVIAVKLLHFRVIWSPRFATMEHSRANTGLVHLVRISWIFPRLHNIW